MLKLDERKCVSTFLRYHGGDFSHSCNYWGAPAKSITNKIYRHKTAENKYRSLPLTTHEQAVLSGFLRERADEFKSWCDVYAVNHGHVMSAIKRMATK